MTSLRPYMQSPGESGPRRRSRRLSRSHESTERLLSPASASGPARLVAVPPVRRRRQERLLGAGGLLASAFLPAGFPHSVSPDYGRFQLWDSVQGLCSYVRGTISTAALLKAAGVGPANDAAVSATLNFLARDMVGHLGGLAFSCWKGHRLDAGAKQWRFAADLLNNVGLLLHMVAPGLPQELFVPTICLASVAHAITGVAGGATRAALTTHFAINDNAADLASKESAQETGVTLVGMALGYLCMRLTAASMRAQWLVFLLLTFLHVAANYAAMRALHMTTLNGERLIILMTHFCRTGHVLTPEEVAARESLLPFSLTHMRLRHDVPRVRLGVPVSCVKSARQGSRHGWILTYTKDAALVALSARHFPEPLTSTQAASFLAEAVSSHSMAGPIHAGLPVQPGDDIFESLCVEMMDRGWGNPLVFVLDDLDEGHRFDEI